MKVLGFICQTCGQPAPRRGLRQKYCEPCSAAASERRVKARGGKVVNAKRKAALAARSVEVAHSSSSSIGDVIRPLDLNWVARVSVPFSWNASKNAIYSLRRTGHVAIRRDAKAWRDALIYAIRDAAKDFEIKQNKLWIDIFVQKESNRGDAVNMVDLVCDAVKVAIDLDDRWFCIRRVDWEVVKQDGRIFVGIGQEDVESVQICSGCGLALPFSSFTRHQRSKHGIGRECRECRSVARSVRCEAA